jgi:uncharacterized protein
VDKRIEQGPKDAPLTLLLAHGAGAGMGTPFMDAFADGIASRGFKVVRFEFPYMRSARETGRRRPPNPAPILLSAFIEEIGAVEGPLAIGGKSMGGRIASMLLEEVPALGCICLGYPFHPPGKPERLRTAHLLQAGKPILVLQGERDPFGRRGEIETYGLSAAVRVDWIEDGEHSFKPRKSSGRTEGENWRHAAEVAASFLDGLARSTRG